MPVCKSCSSDRAEWITQSAVDGRSDDWISARLAEAGVNISKSAISRHRVQCLNLVRDTDKPVKQRYKHEAAEPRAPIDTTTAMREIVAAGPMEPQRVAAALHNMVIDQLAIVRTNQLAYQQGLIPPPVDDVKILDSLHKLMREEAVVAHLEIDRDATIAEKANAVAQAAITGLISPANAERLLGVLGKQLELIEYESIQREIEQLKAAVDTW